MQRAIDIANAIILLGVKNQLPVSQTKLQKLLYYAQGYYLAFEDEPLLDGEFKKWPFGPVHIPVYEQFKLYPGSCLTQPSPKGGLCVDDTISQFLQAIWKKYGSFSASRLSDMSHREAPWIEAQMYDVIPNTSIHNYFKWVVSEGQRRKSQQSGRQLAEKAVAGGTTG
ncbi:MAG: DUF4065 domain-containing protein [Candidatus Melainabacteria bacterium]|nr:MAG: DUF4065 domain-containing protein [Candidatus Melainabacteria bacterium]